MIHEPILPYAGTRPYAIRLSGAAWAGTPGRLVRICRTTMTQFNRLVRALDGFATTPLATLLALAGTAVWLASGFAFRFSASWQLVMSTASAVVTLVMVFVIASAQKRNTAALHLKIDMLVEAHPELSNRAVGVEDKPDHHFHEMREELAARVSQAERGDGQPS